VVLHRKGSTYLLDAKNKFKNLKVQMFISSANNKDRELGENK